MKKYELLLVLPGTLDENEAEARSAEVLSLVKEKDEKVHMDILGKNRLAYPIKLIRYGYVYAIVFSVEPEDLKYIQDKLGLERDLLRSIISVFNAKSGANSRIAYSSNTVTEEKKEEVLNRVQDDKKEVKKEEVKPAKVKAKVKAKVEAKVEVEEKTEKTEKPAKVKEEKIVKESKKVDMDAINKKLDEILDGDIKLDV